jgi:isohexenylglutaconyl-CoA hydratase
MFDLINEMPQVVVMLVEGAAIAGGLGMVCTGDVVVVTRDAKFAMTETTLGIPPAQIAPFVAARLGLPVARRLMLTAARFDGAEAGRLGLADYVVDDAAGLDRIAADIKAQVMRCAPGANAVTKEVVLATRHLDRSDMLDLAAKGFAGCMLSAEGREGIASFLEKRKPSWAERSD